MYFISKDQELDQQTIIKFLREFQQNELPKLKKLDKYYRGIHKILFKEPSDSGRPCNKIVVNYCHTIADQFTGYLTGQPVSYSNIDDVVLDILKYNDVITADSDLLENTVIHGIGFEINYIDEDGQQRFRALDPKECIPVYYNNLNQDLAAVIRFYQYNIGEANTDTFSVEVYEADKTTYYSSVSGFSSLSFIEERKNYFNQVPITVLDIRESVFQQVMGLNDAYETLLSSSIDDWESFCDAYLILKGQIADEDDLKSMKEHRCLMLDADADASYLTKNVNDTQIQNQLKTVNDQIFKRAACPDLNDENFVASSGIALKLKLVGFENKAGKIANQLRKALQKRIELICSIMSLTGTEASWRDAEIVVNRNLPVELENIAEIVNKLRGLVSNETLLSQIPFVTDVAEELKKVQKEQEANMSMYQLGDDDADTDETEE